MKTTTTIKRILLACFALLVLGGADSCDPPLNQDPGFDFWCGNRLCAWNLEYGSVQRVPTWHRSDFGVSLIGPKVSLWQDIDASATSVQCLEITLQADTDEGVELALTFDFFKDGSVEYSHPLVSDDYRTVTYKLKAPSYFDDLRLRIVKTGAGRAVLTRVRLGSSSSCSGAPLDTGARPLGIVCEKDAQCDSLRCSPALQWHGGGPQGANYSSTCAACDIDADCAGGELCGQRRREHAKGNWYRGCVAQQSKGLAERCAVDGECASGTCCEGICSECCPGAGTQPAVPCAEDGRCEQRFPSCGASKACQTWIETGPKGEIDAHLSTWQCDPDAAKGQPKDACLRDADCASGRCRGGTLRQCLLTGESCTADADCLMATCLEIGVADGACD